MKNRRKYSRLTFQTESALLAGGREYVTTLNDISLKGALVEKPKDWPQDPRLRCTLRIQLLGSQIAFLMEMEVANSDRRGLGLRCISIDVDSVIHLRRLLELNLGDPTLAERELAALG